MEKLNSLSFAEERVLCTVAIERDHKGSLGIQITEGSDGNVYIQSVIHGGPAHATGNIQRGDQVVAVDGESLLGIKYNQALDLLKNRGNIVEFILARGTPNSQPRSQVNARTYKDLQMKDENNYCSDRSQMSFVSRNRSKTCDSPIEKHLTESCYDISNFHKYGLSNKYQGIPYHKHIRYEIEQEKLLPKNKQFSLSKLMTPNTLNKTMSKSCSHLYSQDRDRAIVVEMIPKENVDLSCFHSLDRKYLKTLTHDDNNTKSPGTIPPIALPRSLGLGRKWRGPVRYPVTPIKKSATDNDADGYAYISTSDEEQVFI